MSLFVKEKKSETEKTAEQKKAKKKTASVAIAKKTADSASGKISEIAATVLIEPLVTEKSHEKMAEGKYSFKIGNKSGKRDVKRAIEELYGVSVEKVNIVRIPAKKRYAGMKIGWKSSYKKAVATLKKGDKIELFEGV